MNVLFSVIFLISNFILLILAPQDFLPALLDGASKSASLCLSLIATYSVWMGLMNVWKQSGITRVFSKILKPVAKKLFQTQDEQTLDCVCTNLSVNLLGVSGMATPYGIQAVKLLDKSEKAEYASAMFFVLNATSLQLIPTSVIGIRVALQSTEPANIILPTLVSTVFSSLIGVLLVWVLIAPKRRHTRVGFYRKSREQV